MSLQVQGTHGVRCMPTAYTPPQVIAATVGQTVLLVMSNVQLVARHCCTADALGSTEQPQEQQTGVLPLA